MESDERYNPYCKLCGGCGEDGCCPAEFCKFSIGGLYCESYLMDLKFGNTMYRDIFDLVTTKEGKKKLDEVHSKNWDLIYKNNVGKNPIYMGWIGVKERLPKMGQGVLIMLKGGAMTIAYRTEGGTEGFSKEYAWQLFGDKNKELWVNEDDFVTHWMPLPSPPTK